MPTSIRSALTVALAAAIIAGTTSPSAQSVGAKALFHGNDPFRQVGVKYWLQTGDGTLLTERSARLAGGTFTLHLRSNTPGFLGVWTTADGAMLTPRDGGFPGHRLDGHSEYLVPGRFRFAASAADGHVVVLFARSQTEMAIEPRDAIDKLTRLAEMVSTDGHPSVVVEFDELTRGEIGTYVVNRDGYQPGAIIPLARAD